MGLARVAATAYVTPLREGGSLPGLVEADDLGTYVVKFRGAGQGVQALVAEVVSGELARALGLPVPDLALVDLDPAIARSEPDEEVQDLLAASPGWNLGMDFLPGSIGFDGVTHAVDRDLAARILWFDALVGNVDRSWRNPNLLVWHGRLWCIDHGATLTFQHAWGRSAAAFAGRPYDAADHILGARGRPGLAAADAALRPQVTPDVLAGVLALVPDDWLLVDDAVPLQDRPHPETPDALRDEFVALLSARVDAAPGWLPGGPAA